MEDKQSDSTAKSQNTWESTLLFVAIMFTIVISIIGWYIKKDMEADFAPAVQTTVIK